MHTHEQSEGEREGAFKVYGKFIRGELGPEERNIVGGSCLHIQALDRTERMTAPLCTSSTTVHRDK